MAYTVNPVLIPALSSNIAAAAAGLYVQSVADLPVTRTPAYPPSTSPPVMSRVKIMRPDGTWATAYQVQGVHVQMPDGTWQAFN